MLTQVSDMSVRKKGSLSIELTSRTERRFRVFRAVSPSVNLASLLFNVRTSLIGVSTEYRRAKCFPFGISLAFTLRLILFYSQLASRYRGLWVCKDLSCCLMIPGRQVGVGFYENEHIRDACYGGYGRLLVFLGQVSRL